MWYEMPYKVIVPELFVLKSVGEFSRDGKVLGHDHVAKLWLEGEIVPDEDVSPVVVDHYDNEVGSIRSKIVRVDAKDNPVDSVPDEDNTSDEPKKAVVSRNKSASERANAGTDEAAVKEVSG